MRQETPPAQKGCRAGGFYTTSKPLTRMQEGRRTAKPSGMLCSVIASAMTKPRRRSSALRSLLAAAARRDAALPDQACRIFSGRAMQADARASANMMAPAPRHALLGNCNKLPEYAGP